MTVGDRHILLHDTEWLLMIKYLSKGGPWMLACCSYTNMTICIIQFNAVRYFLHAVYSPIIVHIGATIGLLPFSCWVHQLLPPGSCVLRKAVTYCAHTAFIKKAVLRRHPLLVICLGCVLSNLSRFYIIDDEIRNNFVLFSSLYLHQICCTVRLGQVPLQPV